MMKHQIRVVREHEEISALAKSLSGVLGNLKDRARKLSEFIDSAHFQKLATEEQVRLKDQYYTMVLCANSLSELTKYDHLPGYLKALEQRIEAFTSEFEVKE